jgi:PKD repeat protein
MPIRPKGIYYSNLKWCKDRGYTGPDSTPTTTTGSAFDSFNRIDTPAYSTLGSTEDETHAFWHNYGTQTGEGSAGYDWYIGSGVATNYNGAWAACYLETGTYDCTVYVTLPKVGVGGGGLWLRGSVDGSSGIAVDVGGIYTVTGTSTPAILNWTSPGYTDGDTLRVDLAGPSVTVTRIRSGVSTQLGQTTTVFNQTNRCHGLWCYATSTPRTTWSNFTIVDNLAPNQTPNADFLSSVTDAVEVQFVSSSSDPDGAISQWYWQFGDGQTSIERNPKHVYETPGTYLVTLTVFDNRGASDSVEFYVEATRAESGSSRYFAINLAR